MASGALRQPIVDLVERLGPTLVSQATERRIGLSVVLCIGASTRGWEEMMQQVAPLCARHGIELVAVACGAAVPEPRGHDAHDGNVRWVALDTPGAQELRAAGLAAATGDVVRLVDRPTLIDERWLSEMGALLTTSSAR
jgi:hypothetical protein